ncbi:MAG: thiamine-phosphate kinase, partial [Myxococcota bacterium]
MIKTIESIGEFGLIEQIQTWCQKAYRSPQTDQSIGDDTALWNPTPGHQSLLTTDVQVEGQHFLPQMFTQPEWAYLVGKRCATVNLSDIAAMAGTPRIALISLGLRKTLELDILKAWYRGLLDAFDETQTQVVGGNLSCTQGPVFMSVTLIGEAPAHQAVLRSGSQIGDHIGLIGHVGCAKAGLESLHHRFQNTSSELSPSTCSTLERAYLEPRAYLHAARSMAPYINAMMDVSDGLGADLQHLCRAAGLGARLDFAEIPASQALREWAKRQQADLYMDYLLAPSDDYALLFSAPDKAPIERQIQPLPEYNLHWVGRCMAE